MNQSHEELESEALPDDESSRNVADELPFITNQIPGIGGKIKDLPSHFQVTEIPPYRPSGGGPYILISISRQGWNTRDLMKALSKVFNVSDSDVGCSGLKDKNAVVTQWFSLKLPGMELNDVVKRIQDSLPVSVLDIARHDRPLKIGYLKGNDFRIILTECEVEMDSVRRITDKILENGLPNFYGPQRFGIEGNNLARGRNILTGTGDPSSGWLRKFLLSAMQSYLFNSWLVERMERGLYDRLIPGDIAQKTSGGGVFPIANPDSENARFIAGEISYTGPIYGYQMRRPTGEEEKLEELILIREGLAMKHFRKNNLKGSRRSAIVRLKELNFSAVEEGLEFRFSLPAGAYATMVMREFMKIEGKNVEGRSATY